MFCQITAMPDLPGLEDLEGLVVIIGALLIARINTDFPLLFDLNL